PGENGIAGIALRRANDDPAAAHGLPDVVVRLTGQVELDPGRQERAEALARRAVEARTDPPGRWLRAETMSDHAAQPGSDGAVPGRDRIGGLDQRRALESGLRLGRQPLAELAAPRDRHRLAVVPAPRRPQQRREVERIRSRIARLAPAQEVRAADCLL